MSAWAALGGLVKQQVGQNGFGLPQNAFHPSTWMQGWKNSVNQAQEQAKKRPMGLGAPPIPGPDEGY